MDELFIPGRPAAIQVVRTQGANLEHISRDTGVRFYRASPEAAALQIRLNGASSHTYAHASLNIHELRNLRVAISDVIDELMGRGPMGRR